MSLGENAVAVTAKSSTLSKSEFDAAKKVAEEIGIAHEIVQEDELDDPRFVKNPTNRCYYCRSGLVIALKKLAVEKKIKYVLDGANAGDLKGHRPGLKALREHGALSPLLELGFSKKDIRNIEDAGGIGQQSVVFDNLYKQEKFEQAKKALKLLSPEQREIVVLRVWENMPYQQIAELVGSTEGACKMAFSRAIKILRQSMPITLAIILLFSIINNQ